MKTYPDFVKENGLLPVIVQDYRTLEVLMLAWINKESWELSINTGYMHYWSRSRNRLWKKGESSGNLQEIKEVFLDCDKDAVLVKVNQIGGAACHTGRKSCFFNKVENDSLTIISEPVFDPQQVYGNNE